MFDVNAVIKTAQEAAEPKTIEVEGLSYAKNGLQLIAPPLVKTLEVNSLVAVVDYLKGHPDGENVRRFLVCGEDEVIVYSEPDEKSRQRPRWLQAKDDTAWGEGNVGYYRSQVDFTIWLQTCFAPTPDRERALAIAANLKAEKVVDGADNGLAQTVAVRAGAKSEFVNIANPFLLAPFRTFPEIEPVASPFVLRLQNGKENEPPQLALFAGADATWCSETRKRVKAYLAEALSDLEPAVVILG